MRKSIIFIAICATLAGVAAFTALGYITYAGSGGDVVKPATYPNRHHFTQAIFWFELLDNREELFEALGDPLTPRGADLRRIMDITNIYDALLFSAYPPLFAFLLVLLFLLNRRCGEETAWTMPILVLGFVACAVMPVADYMENAQLLKLTRFAAVADVDGSAISSLKAWTRIKWGAIFAVTTILALRYWGYFRDSKLPRYAFAAIYGITAVLGAVSLMFTGTRFLIEASSTVMGVGWLVSTAHAGAVAVKELRMRY